MCAFPGERDSGIALAGEGKFKEAREEFVKALKNNPW